jgi:hypothetical protein
MFKLILMRLIYKYYNMSYPNNTFFPTLLIENGGSLQIKNK